MADYKLLRQVLEDIIAGKLEYNPLLDHCENSHTLAGWLEVIKAKEQGWTYDPQQEAFINNEGVLSREPLGDTWTVAEEAVGVKDKYESVHLFVDSTLTRCMCVLEWLEQGKSIKGFPPERGKEPDYEFEAYVNNHTKIHHPMEEEEV